MHLPKVVIFERFQLVHSFLPSMQVHSPLHRTPLQIKHCLYLLLILYLHRVCHQHDIHRLHPLYLHLIYAINAR